MALIKWEPFDDIDRFFRDVSTLPGLRGERMGWDLAADVYEDGDRVVAEMNLPGLKADDIDVEVEHNHLRVAGRREAVDEQKGKSHYTKEIRRGSFERVVPLPNEVATENVTATYKDGVLTVVMHKKERPNDKRVKVQVS